MKIHELKIWRIFFVPVCLGVKTFEIRNNDRDFNVGDYVLFREFLAEDGEYSGKVLMAKITYILSAGYGLAGGYCVFGFERLEK